MKKLLTKLLKSKVGKFILCKFVKDMFTAIREENKTQLLSTMTIGDAINKIEEHIIQKIEK